jgi:hypothetical protein
MKQDNKIQLGQKVIVNTGGKATIAIIDYPTIRKDIHGKERDFKISYNNGFAYLCRFTDDVNKCWIGGAKRTNERTEGVQYLFENAQFIPAEHIKPIN